MQFAYRLIDINAGQKILVRLRPPYAPDTFYDEEDVLHTMLHEVRISMYLCCAGILTSLSQLTHNVHGPHDDKFYKFLAGLEEEYAALRKSGYDGEGFHSAGRRLGTDVSHDLPPHLARQKALDAAEKRRQISLVLGAGGRLGGAAKDANKTPRELAAEVRKRVQSCTNVLLSYHALPHCPCRHPVKVPYMARASRDGPKGILSTRAVGATDCRVSWACLAANDALHSDSNSGNFP